MTNSTMLIDATHPEETRVVVMRGNRIEDFDFEAQSRRPLRGNIYLAKVTRVEPSLQACFVDYGGNRHGFLPFSEIHPDYYQIPVADREALIEEEARFVKSMQAEEKAREENAEEAEDIGDDAAEEARVRHFRRSRQYKIQEVVKRRQIMLVQVVKEERGNKGAAITTYLSLAGRYAVLMPNTARGGGISRKITSGEDRKRLREIVSELEVPEGMGVILRTAGASRTKTEIKRDFDYLLRLWDSVRELTLQSLAPKLVYEEGSLIKRVIRDLYTKETGDVIVAGEEGYREAKDFMKMLMPSHAKNVKLDKETKPLFSRYGIEAQLDAMFMPQVQLRSGGYLVINQTEALVSIDVNSGRSTREHNIEDTALKTNLEAADEVARQLRLRDLAGLIVVDFIDMSDRRHNRTVEKRLKDALKNDRARIQVGSISNFGLLEMSRQRIRAGVVEGSMVPCPHCSGTGLVRSLSSATLAMLRALEDWIQQHRNHQPIVRTRSDIVLYLLNQKREHLTEIEQRYNLAVRMEIADLTGQTLYTIDRGELRPLPAEEPTPQVGASKPSQQQDDEDELVDTEDFEENQNEQSSFNEKDEEDGQGRRRRRRRRRRGRGRGSENAALEQNSDETREIDDTDELSDENSSKNRLEDENEQPTSQEEEPKGRNRRRRGSGARRQEDSNIVARNEETVAAQADHAARKTKSASGDDKPLHETVQQPAAPKPALVNPAQTNVEYEPVEDRRSRWRERFAKMIGLEETSAPTTAELTQVTAAPAQAVEKNADAKKKVTRKKKTVPDVAAETEATENTAPPAEENTSSETTAKRGWWRRSNG